ncbi:MAG TPA: hypothetical protein VGV08_00895 [Casimicrobiaceae bacterium]|nr:hypothetical protein [Casimicrobiaceae bacterium]
MPLVLVAPGLLSSPADALDRDRAFAALAAHAEDARSHPEGIAGAMLAASRCPIDTPVAPHAALGAGADPGNAFVIVADPVHLDAGHNDVVLTQRVDDLERDEADTLVAMLSAHFTDDGLHFVAPRADAWFVLAAQTQELATTPVDAVVGRSLIAHLPQGPDAGTWKRWQDEIGMLLHDHPVNAAREARARPSANAVWFWGGGRLADAGTAVDVAAAAGRTGDIARGIALASRGSVAPWPPPAGWLDASLRQHRAGGHGGAIAAATIVVTDTVASAGDIAMFARDWLAPALVLLKGGRVDALHVVADGSGIAATWTAAAPGRLARLRPRWRRPRFRIPVAPGE